MPRKIIFIIIGALLFLALLALLWFWFLHRSPAADTGKPSGFATSTDRSAGGTGKVASQDGYEVTLDADGYLISANGEDGISDGLYRISQGGNIVGTFMIGHNGVGKYTLTPQGITGGGTLPSGSYTFAHVAINNSDIGSTTPRTTSTSTVTGGVNTGAWLGSNTSERVFSATDIADINSISVGGTPLISTTAQSASLSTSGLVLGLTAAACVAQWAANKIGGYISTALDETTYVALGTSMLVFDLNAAKQRNETKTNTVMQCLIKSIAQAAIDQITRSIVTWINSGFNGSPSFVTNFNSYFSNVADQAAGEFIKSSSLSFLCSPFSLQIKIAIAQSYANRNSGASCSLTKVTSNINSFLKGNWSSGGWGGLLQLTTMPTNNPYGAYAYAQIGLNNSISNAQNNSNRNITSGGFISVQKCDTSKGQSVGNGNCTVSTPGQVAQEAMNKSLGSSVDQLNIAQSIDSIVSALTNQLILKTLYGGLASANDGVTNVLAAAVDQDASNQAKALLTSLQSSATYAVQYGSAKQGSASDIQQVQNNFNTLYNCWQNAASSTALSAAQQTQAAQSANAANAQITQLEGQISVINSDITRANAALASIQNLQSQVLFATTAADVTTANNAIQAASGSLISAADVTTAQQNRAALQTQLTATNQTATSGLTQCRALSN